MHPDGVVISVLLSLLTLLVAYTARTNNTQANGLVSAIESIQRESQRQNEILAVLQERLTNHLTWSENVFDERGVTRPSKRRV